MASLLTNLKNLLRIRQYYKNFLVFVALFFSQSLFHFQYYIPLIIGFLLLSFTSSINYIINDIRDIENDRTHPEKLSKKPLASGEISVRFAIIIIILLTCVIILSLLFIIPNLSLAIILLLLFLTGQLYNHFFKFHAFIDILTLSIGYLWRALAGVVISDKYITSWLFLAIFEVALFLVLAKRKGDLMILGDRDSAIEHKKVYNEYSIKLIDQFHVITAGALFMTYSLYLIFRFNLLSGEELLINEYIAILSIPIVLYILMRFMYLTSAKPEIARNTEKAIFDKGIVIAGLVLGIILIYSFYFEQILEIFNQIFNIT